jgi:SAM-dependent methyltransferase
VDYDLTNIPAGYDRGRDHGPEVLDLWMDVIESHVDGGPFRTILDLGCGTGRFCEGLASRFRAHVVGVDPSEKMLDQARRKRQGVGVHYERGTAEAIPLVDGAVDMIFMSMSFHHFRDPEQAARECRRVLRADGSVVVRAATREQIPSYPYVPFFPGTRSMLEDLLPDRPRLCAVFETAGFRCVEWQIVTQAIAPSWAAYADKLSAGGDSVLARLTEEELASGLDAVRRHRDGPGRPVVEPIDVLFFR